MRFAVATYHREIEGVIDHLCLVVTVYFTPFPNMCDSIYK
jgi:hypothetical protein